MNITNPMNDPKKKPLIDSLLGEKDESIKYNIAKQNNYLTRVIAFITCFVEFGFTLWFFSQYGVFPTYDRHVFATEVMCLSISIISVFVFIFLKVVFNKIQNNIGLHNEVIVIYMFILVLFGILLSAIYKQRDENTFVLVLFLICSFGVVIIRPVRLFLSSALVLVIYILTYWNFGVLRISHSLNIIEIIFYLNIIALVRYYTTCGFLDTTQKLSGYSAVLERLSFTDELTAINNRNALRKNWESFNGRILSVIVLDIDDFKHYNDTYGHLTGDKVIKEVASLMSHEFGADDCYRMGGDEFMIITEYVDEEAEARIWDVMEQTKNIVDEGELLGVTLSVGAIKVRCKNAGDLREYMKRADVVLYDVKENGKNNYRYVNLVD